MKRKFGRLPSAAQSAAPEWARIANPCAIARISRMGIDVAPVGCRADDSSILIVIGPINDFSKEMR
jgi:hypothetical protein